MEPDGSPRVVEATSGAYRHRKAADVIASELRRSIVEGGRPGDYLSPEKELVKQFGVSRPTLRESLRILESEGLIEIRRGLRGGAVIREPAIDELAFRFGIYLQLRHTRLEDVFLARRIIEPAAARLAAEAAAQGAPVERLNNLLEAESAAIAAMNDDAGPLSRTLVDFHDGIMELAGSTTLSVIWKLLDQVIAPYILSSLRGLSTPESKLEAAKRSHSAHQALAKAIRAKNPEQAERTMRKHLDAAQYATRHVVEGHIVDAFTEVPQAQATEQTGNGDAATGSRCC